MKRMPLLLLAILLSACSSPQTLAASPVPITPIATFTPTVTPTPILGVGSTWISAKDGMTMMYVPAGEFSMGSNEGSSNEKPVHTVSLDSYWIDQTEVTNAMYAKCVRDGVCNQPSSTDYFNDLAYAEHPVVYVSWEDAKAYCEWRGDGTHLPTEAEWEKGASWDGDKKQKRVYPWGDSMDLSFANYWGRDNSCVGGTTEVGSYSVGASFYGLLDMAGNVWEWVADWYDSNYHDNSPSSNPKGPSTGDFRVLRGGSWNDDYGNLRSSYRNRLTPDYYDGDIGFRCSRSE